MAIRLPVVTKKNHKNESLKLLTSIQASKLAKLCFITYIFINVRWYSNVGNHDIEYGSYGFLIRHGQS